MKNKKFTYFLGFAVLIVWGLIIYRIIGTIDTGDDAATIAPVSTKKEPFNDYAVPKDTTRLILNYRDPFGLIPFKDTVKAVSHERTAHDIILAAAPAINWGFIKYSGYIRNPGSRQLIALVQINGKSADMREGDVVDKVKLLKNMQDSVKVLFNGKTKFITIQHG
ncbi:hypothetical protein [Mucilaginibacter sp.]